MLILSRKPGESLIINEEIELKIIDVSGDKVKIGINAPQNVKILRSELKLTVESNRDAVSGIAPKQLHNLLSGLKKSGDE